MKDILPKESFKVKMVKKKRDCQELDEVTSDEVGSYFGTNERKNEGKWQIENEIKSDEMELKSFWK